MKRRSPMIRTAFLLLLPATTLAAMTVEAPATMSVQPRAALHATLLPTVHVVADARGDAARFAVAQEEALPVTLMPTVYVHARIAAYAAVDFRSDVLLAVADAMGDRAVDALGNVAGQPGCIAPHCASAPY
jgi:hypothetical protein